MASAARHRFGRRTRGRTRVAGRKRRRRYALPTHSMARGNLRAVSPWSAVASAARHRFGRRTRGRTRMAGRKRRRRYAVPTHSKARCNLRAVVPWSAVASAARHRFGRRTHGRTRMAGRKRRRRYALPTHSKARGNLRAVVPWSAVASAARHRCRATCHKVNCNTLMPRSVPLRRTMSFKSWSPTCLANLYSETRAYRVLDPGERFRTQSACPRADKSIWVERAKLKTEENRFHRQAALRR